MADETTEEKKVPSKTQEEKYWYGITNVDKNLGLFQIPNSYLLSWWVKPKNVEPNEGWKYDRYLLAQADAALQASLRDGVAKLHRSFKNREDLDDFLRGIILKISLAGFNPDACSAIIDFTRTSLPQLSGKQMRDAFAMGSYVSHWEENYGVYFGFSNNPLVYNGHEWRKPEDLGGMYYERMRAEHPLVIYWKIPQSHLGLVIHPDFHPDYKLTMTDYPG
ncbi:MAG: hypothetical protein HYW90_00505 [Candidatus Sungbacteria bacterium]|nr:hypothetical protein [Candidatus Sungbacteria bacterium]